MWLQVLSREYIPAVHTAGGLLNFPCLPTKGAATGSAGQTPVPTACHLLSISMPCASPNETWGLEGLQHLWPLAQAPRELSRSPQQQDGEWVPTHVTHASRGQCSTPRELARGTGELVNAIVEAERGSEMRLLCRKGLFTGVRRSLRMRPSRLAAPAGCRLKKRAGEDWLRVRVTEKVRWESGSRRQGR